MNDEGTGWIGPRYGQLSTGVKMLLILSLGLLPLGIIAIFASIDTARENRAKGELEARTILAVSAQRVTSALQRTSITIRAVSDAISESPPGSHVCRRALERLSNLPPAPGRYALYGNENNLRCATEGFEPPPFPPPGQALSDIEILEGEEVLRLVLFDSAGQADGVSDYRRAALMDLLDVERLPAPVDLALVQNGREMRLHQGYRQGPLTREVHLVQPLANGRIELRVRAPATPISAAESIMILLPVLMWLFAAGIGWLVVDRLLLRPLVRMQKVVSAYRPGDRSLDLPTVRSPAREIDELGAAFDQVTRTVAQHEADLEAAVDRQTRLVREVHHRVKNNLQVVASLLNLHSRGSPNEEVAAAYASIQRRVDALAVVHRNHYAELEENRGVALKPLISELAANLRGTAPPAAENMQIRLGIEPYYATQDVAVSVAFLITEIVEFGMLCGSRLVSIILEDAGPVAARLSIESDSLTSEIACEETLFNRFDRIVTGLSRQLRSTLDRDPKRGRYSVVIAVIDRGES